MNRSSSTTDLNSKRSDMRSHSTAPARGRPFSVVASTQRTKLSRSIVMGGESACGITRPLQEKCIRFSPLRTQPGEGNNGLQSGPDGADGSGRAIACLRFETQQSRSKLDPQLGIESTPGLADRPERAAPVCAAQARLHQTFPSRFIVAIRFE